MDHGVDWSLTTEKASTETKKFERDTNAGVLCVTNRNGMIGSFATYFSTRTKAIPKTALATSSPHTIGSLHASSESPLVLRVNDTNRQDTVDTSVALPKKSILPSFVLNDWSVFAMGMCT